MKLTMMNLHHTIMCGTLALTLGLAGCAHKPATLPPGAINAFDATSYDVLMTAQGAINGFKSQINTLPSSEIPKVSPVLDQAKDYNTAEAAWQAYHAGAAGDADALSAALSQLVADLATLQAAMPANSK